MEGIVFVIGFFAVIIGISWGYYTLKSVAKRKLFFKGQYERQRAMIDNDLVLTTVAPMPAVMDSLSRYIPDDRSAKAACLGGAMRVTMEGPNRLVYTHLPKFTTGGGGDRFAASVTFEQSGPQQLQAVVSIDEWRENDGVTRRAGIDAMERFRNEVVAAFRAVDPNTTVGGRGQQLAQPGCM